MYITTSVLIRFTTSHHCGKTRGLTNFQHIHLLKPKPLQSIFANHFSSSIGRFFRHLFSAWANWQNPQGDRGSNWGQIFVKWIFETNPNRIWYIYTAWKGSRSLNSHGSWWKSWPRKLYPLLGLGPSILSLRGILWVNGSKDLTDPNWGQFLKVWGRVKLLEFAYPPSPFCKTGGITQRKHEKTVCRPKCCVVCMKIGRCRKPSRRFFVTLFGML